MNELQKQSFKTELFKLYVKMFYFELDFFCYLVFSTKVITINKLSINIATRIIYNLL